MLFPRRQYVEMLDRRRGNGFVKIITGIRRCGKSFLLFNLFRRHLEQDGTKASQFIEIILDDERFEALRNPRELAAYIRRKVKIGAGPHYVFIDEIQYCCEVPSTADPNVKITFYDVLNGLLRMKDVDVYVTGSNSRLLASDIATNFRDRGDVVRIHPLSFGEVFETVGGRETVSWNNYLLYGGMPGAVLKENADERMNYLTSLYRTVYLADLVERHCLKDDYALGKTVDVISSAVGSLTNPTRLSNSLQTVLGVKTSIPTVKKYLDILTDAYLFSRAERYNVKGRRYLDFPSKYYAEDVGLRNARLGWRQGEPTHLMENVIYNELVRGGAKVDVGVVDNDVLVNGKRNRSPLEIDFVVNAGMERIYVQSAYAIPDAEKRNQETMPLRKIGDGFRKVVIVGGSEPFRIDENGIAFVGVIDFLLEPDVLWRGRR